MQHHLPNPNDGDPPTPDSELSFHDDVDSTCSTPYVSARSSPGRGPPPPGFFFSAPASPIHFVLSSSSSSSDFVSSSADFSADFEFSARFNSSSSSATGSMISANELFLNGQIRPMKLSSHLQRPQSLAPLLDLEVEEEDEDDDEDNEGGDGAGKEGTQTTREKSDETSSRGRSMRLRSKSVHRRTRSLSPLRNWRSRDGGRRERSPVALDFTESDIKETTAAEEPPSDATTPSVSASSSRSNSTSSRSSKRWVFLMDFLHRSKSEGRGHSSKEKLWSSISFSPSQKDKKPSPSVSTPSSPSRKSKQQTTNGAASAKKPAGKRQVPPSPHELLYTANRAQAEEMKKKTYLPYRQGLLGCLGFSSKSYGAMNGFSRALNPVSSS